ncbi:MAG: hypothetical protein IJD51_02270 [Clostridia bacterium]|nr:hypothetical protein [Clostridia bacterium]
MKRVGKLLALVLALALIVAAHVGTIEYGKIQAISEQEAMPPWVASCFFICR